MHTFRQAILEVLKLPEVRAAVRRDEDLYRRGDNLLKQNDLGIISMVSISLSLRDDLIHQARRLIQLEDPTRFLLQEIVRSYILCEPDGEDVRIEILRIYHEKPSVPNRPD
ncbi:MAG: hypothetical protein HWE39_10035 [Oceanospirillaceae bacterium]|nr:hypothetical protein [Oceanospirillaceae bacterium]